MQIKKKKLEQMGEKQEKKKEEQQKKDDAPMDTDDMPLFISNTNSNDGLKGMKKKHIFNKKPTKPPIRKK